MKDTREKDKEIKGVVTSGRDPTLLLVMVLLFDPLMYARRCAKCFTDIISFTLQKGIV